MVELRSTDAQGETIPMVLIPRLAREGLFGPPNQYLIREADVVPLKTLFEQLGAATDAPLVPTLIRWFHKAVEDSALPADAVINLIVALEALFLDGDYKKAVTLAERGAVFLGIDGPTREKHFVNLHALYRARNKVLHEGNEYPTVQLTTGREITIVELQEYGFAYVRDALRKMLEAPGQIKAELLSALKERVKPLRTELGRYRTTYFA
ncbi:MAG: hypothetical protein ABID84_01785 [Chloroflexota bacterium]